MNFVTRQNTVKISILHKLLTTFKWVDNTSINETEYTAKSINNNNNNLKDHML